MTICESLLGIVLAQAEQHNAKRVLEVNIEVGELRAIVPDYLRYYFDLMKQSTLAEGAVLKVSSVPGRAQCPCGASFVPKPEGALCPDCGGQEGRIVAGLELRVKTMSVE